MLDAEININVWDWDLDGDDLMGQLSLGRVFSLVPANKWKFTHKGTVSGFEVDTWYTLRNEQGQKLKNAQRGFDLAQLHLRVCARARGEAFAP